MYEYDDIQVMANSAVIASESTIDKRGINIYVNSFGDDGASHDIHIDPRDAKGIELFRQFATKIAEHFKTL